jgi:acyl carrier protein
MLTATRFDRIEDVQALVNEVFAGSFSGAAFSPDADFFELGGTSLSLAIVLTELENRLNTEIPVATFLEKSNARDFAIRLHAMLNR